MGLEPSSTIGTSNQFFKKIKNLKTMKKAIVILMLISISLQGCIENPEATKTRKPKHETVQIVFYGDLTKSFYNKYTTPCPYMFKPLCAQISESYTLDFRYGVITDCDAPLIRYYVPYVEKDPNASNPWMQNEHGSKRDDTSDWNRFSCAATTLLSKEPTDNSDCASAINRAAICFQEYDSTARKILLLCTDLEDSYEPIPHVAQDVEVYTVALPLSVPVEQILNTKNVKRFESLEAALDFLSKSIH
jgi:hypothetical protein